MGFACKEARRTVVRYGRLDAAYPRGAHDFAGRARRGKAARYLRADGHKLVPICGELLHACAGLRTPVVTARLTQKARAHSDFHAILLTHRHAGRRASGALEELGRPKRPASEAPRPWDPEDPRLVEGSWNFQATKRPKAPRTPHFFMKPSISPSTATPSRSFQLAPAPSRPLRVNGEELAAHHDIHVFVRREVRGDCIGKYAGHMAVCGSAID